MEMFLSYLILGRPLLPRQLSPDLWVSRIYLLGLIFTRDFCPFKIFFPVFCCFLHVTFQDVTLSLKSAQRLRAMGF